MEKRFSIARAGIAGLASLALACGLATTAPYAFAETGEKGTIKVTKADGNDGGYTAIPIFTGDVENGAINGAAWASDAAKTAVLEAITTADPTFTETSAPAAAQKLVELFGGAAGDAYILEDTDFGKAFADALKGLSGTALASGTAVELPEGYVVVLSDSATTKQGTSAIFRAIEKGAAVEINEKATVPTVEKTVVDDKSGNTKEADAQIGQELTFTLKGTLPSNLKTFDTYKYVFNDSLSAGLDFVEIKSIKVGSTTLEVSDLTVNETSSRELKIGFTDLFAKVPGVSATDEVIITYTAKLNKDAVIAGTGNPNTVTITYSRNPHDTGDGETEEDKVKTYTYKLDVFKFDKTTKEALAGAKFSVTGPDGAVKFAKEGDNYVVNPAGTVTEIEAPFSIVGLDADDEYTFSETVVPAGYSKVADFKVTINATYDAADLTAVSYTGTNSDYVALNKNGESDQDGAVSVYNKSEIVLPLTGMKGITAVYILGGLVLAVSTVTLVTRRRKVATK